MRTAEGKRAAASPATSSSVRSLSAATRVAERLLSRMHGELQHVDRPTERVVCDRCTDRLLDAIGSILVAQAAHDAPELAIRALDETVRATREIQWALGWVRRRRAIVPSTYNSLVVGLNVVARRLEEAKRDIARRPGR